MEKSFGEKVAEAKAAVEAVSPEEARSLQQSGAAVIVDPRPAEAIASTTGLIPGARNVPLAELEAGNVTAALGDAHTPVIAACQTGPMGAVAAHALQRRGYANVRYMDGGTQGWLDAGFQTQR